MKRDLKADLEQLKRTKKVFESQQVTFETPEDEIVPVIDILGQQLYTLVGLGDFAVKYGEEWLERAIKAEELARELVETLEIFDTVNVDASMKERIEDAKKARSVLVKAKEVLSDDKVQAGRQSASAKGY
jgi:hypothetical protein